MTFEEFQKKFSRLYAANFSREKDVICILYDSQLIVIPCVFIKLQFNGEFQGSFKV